MKWKNRQFGELDFDEDHILTFPAGLIGFEDCRRYILVNDEDSQPFRWLVSIEEEDLSLPLLDPLLVDPSYGAAQLQKTETTTLVVASIADDIERSTVNLRSPIVISNASRTGRQIILEEEAYPYHHPLFLASQQAAKG